MLIDASVLEQERNNVKKLQRALYYESQYRNAVSAGALSLYDTNITQDIIETDFFFRDEDGQMRSVPERLGMQTPCKFTDLVTTWFDKMIPETSKQKLQGFSNLKEVLIDTYNSGKREFTTDYWAETPNGKKYFLNQRFLLTKNEDGDICALSIVKDYTKLISEKENLEQKELEQYAFYDPITKGYNYNKFKDRMRQMGHCGSIICLDILNFKIINSICGISKGDQVIKSIWENIISIIDTDNGELCAHINGDHYIIFMPTNDGDKIIRTIKNISLSISMIPSELRVPQLSPYFGISNWVPGKKIELAYSEAVAAKHNAKIHQNTNYAFFNEEDTLRMITEKNMTDSFEDAIARKEFKVWFQPKFNPVTKKLVGAEALVRWIISNDTMIPPNQFIPLFEKNNMIRILDEYIFRNVCMILRAWKEAGKPLIPISINISRASLYYNDVANRYKVIADKIGIDKKYIPLEITESAAITNSQIKEIAELFHDSGFSLHMDDFGSGYSSLASLNTMHFDTLKLDKSLIDYIGHFSGDRLLEHTICLAKELGMHVTAEGVEKASQVNFLRHTGCDSIQGYFYSPPVPQAEFEKLLEQYSNPEEKLEFDYLAEHISTFSQGMIKPPIYEFIVNLSKNYFTENTDVTKWEEETQIGTKVYSDATYKLATEYVLPEYQDLYLSFMNREKNIENFSGFEETKILIYERKFDSKISKMRLLYHIFKVQNSDDIWGYITITPY